MFRKVLKKIAVSLLLISTSAISGVEIGGTRLIYNGTGHQAAISVSNPDNTPYLIQSWVSKNENSDDGDSLFVTTPPLFKLNPYAQNSVRVMLAGNAVPQDRESVYWLNIKSIPSSSAEAKNELLIAVKSKMKLFYRPAGLKGDPSLAYQQLTFSAAGGKLSVHNPTPYSVSLYDVKVNGKELAKPPMVLPFQTLSLPQTTVASGEVSWRAINDFGGVTAQHKFKI
ncbi:TPA: molecular chaperone [Klebsiella michiganensis]|uniref:fimbrial biogenesis chaperone n=1 Tax=Klebsiella michiganensis TaxID=1134687 RepID=UPI000669A29D|nr:molecular chaperone [Klebsiella michiganensis]MDG9984763.1 molecular chaperone [Klebsiella michiganensis]MDH0832635.1 molecular chaperone [Klebsiella michiganensis]MDH0845163.1 molecular chaperone [Klebsiella michiganensis]QLS18776.1 molecular chaperone [Klebsiella michiganensis]HBM2976247.1 molecular chaperone [Klebsiella michiganensis]